MENRTSNSENGLEVELIDLLISDAKLRSDSIVSERLTHDTRWGTIDIIGLLLPVGLLISWIYRFGN